MLETVRLAILSMSASMSWHYLLLTVRCRVCLTLIVAWLRCLHGQLLLVGMQTYRASTVIASVRMSGQHASASSLAQMNDTRAANLACGHKWHGMSIRTI